MHAAGPCQHDATCGRAQVQSLPSGPPPQGNRPSLSDRAMPAPRIAPMINTRASSAATCRPRAARSPWKTARLVLLILTILHKAALCLAPGIARTGLLRFVRSRAARLEHIFRRLLLNMRAPAGLPAPAPFTARAEALPRARSGPRRARFSLSLKGLLPQGPPAAEARPEHPSANRPNRPPVPPASAEDQAAARLRNLQSVLEDCWSFAAKLSRRLARLGLRLRAPKAAMPSAELWQIHAGSAGRFTAPAASSGPDTS